MIKNILFLLLAIGLVVLCWGIYQFFGEWTSILFLTIALFLLFTRLKTPKFGKKKRGL